MKELSAGILFFDKDGRLFMGRVTNSKKGEMGVYRWDIPKGHVEEGETPIQAAIRECEEETGFTDYDQSLLVDLGQHEYSSNKDIHLFLYDAPITKEDIQNSFCIAVHKDDDGNIFPELDLFGLIPNKQWVVLMGISLYNVVQKLFPEKMK